MLNLVVNKWYLVNSGWVNNVNNLRLNGCISSDNLSTVKQVLIHKQFNKLVQLRLIRLTILYYSTNISTYLNYKFKLLNKSFTYYPQHLLINLINEI